MAQREQSPKEGDESQPTCLANLFANRGRDWLQWHKGAEEERRGGIDAIDWQMQVGAEAVRLRVANVASVKAVEEIDQDAERQDKEVEPPVQGSMLSSLLSGIRHVSALLRSLQ